MIGKSRRLAGIAALALVASACGEQDIVISAQNAFAGVKSAKNTNWRATPEALVFTDIGYDMQIDLKTPMVYPERIAAFSFRYRVSGPTRHPRAGGELFFAPIGGAFSDAARWQLPPLVRDGAWHDVTLGVDTLACSNAWYVCGGMNRFRFDPTNADGGRLEIAEIRFHVKGSSARRATPAEKFGADDAWPAVTPETFKTLAVKTVSPAAADSVFLGGTAVPRVQTAGRRIHLRFDYRGDVPTAATLPVTLTLVTPQGGVKWTERLTLATEACVHRMPDTRWSLEFDYTLPLYLGAGDCSLSAVSPGIRSTGGHAPTAQLTVRRAPADPAWPEKLTSQVVDVGGSPSFAVGGKPFYPLWGTIAGGRRQDDHPARHSSAPLNVVTVWTRHLEWWPEGDRFDPADLDRIAEEHRREFPGAYFMWDISIYPPPDWRIAHPDDMARDEQGRVNTDCGDAEINFSFASQKAYDDMERVMKRVIDYLEKSPYANRIIGYRINSGHTVEWLGWDPTHRDSILDFSPVAQRGFEAFARAHYPQVTDYSVPTLAERRQLDGTDVVWDPRKHARAIAYHDFYCTAVADGAIRMCRAAKAHLGGRKLVGTYFGYVMTLNGNGCSQMRAHYATKRFLDARAADFVMSPQDYGLASRQPGSQICDMKPFRSIQNHGMVSVIEDDTRTHNIIPCGYSQTLTEAMTVNMLRRNMGVALCRNQPFYTYAITSGYEFDFPQFADDAAALAQAGAFALATRTARKAEIAVVVSEEAVKAAPMLRGHSELYAGRTMQAYARDGSVERHACIGGPKIAGWIHGHGLNEMARIGAGVDFLLAEDLADHPGDYKLYVMAACTKSTPALVRAAARLRERDCTILWTYAPGYVADTGLSTANMKALTGLDFALCRDVTDPGVTLADGRRIGSLAYPKGHPPLSPIFAAVGADRVLGRYATGAAGLAESRTGRARTVFSGSHFVDAPTLRRFAREAGVHIFCDSSDVLEANERFVMLHARNAGKKTIRLPRKTTVVDVFAHACVARNADAFTFDADLHATRLFCYGDEAEKLLPEARDTPVAKAGTVPPRTAKAPPAPPRARRPAVNEFTCRGGIAASLEKLRRGGPFTLVYFGGSITEGTSYRPPFTAWLQAHYPQAKIREINAGIGGTGSDLGAYRMEHDVLRHRPDLLFVEFALNDSGAADPTGYVESIVRQAWRQDPKTDIVFLHTISRSLYESDFKRGVMTRSADLYEALAEHYRIPTVNFAPRVTALAKAGTLVWTLGLAPTAVPKEDPHFNEKVAAEMREQKKIVFSNDTVHPRPEGGQLYVASLTNFFAQAMPRVSPDERVRLIASAPRAANPLLKPVSAELRPEWLKGAWHRADAHDATLARFLPRTDSLWVADAPGDRLEFSFEGTEASLYALYGPTGARIAVSADGVPQGTRDLCDRYCTYWRLMRVPIYRGAKGRHTVTVTVTREQPDRRQISAYARMKPEQFDGHRLAVGRLFIDGTFAAPHQPPRK